MTTEIMTEELDTSTIDAAADEIIELTSREIAIAQGEDPDAVVDEVADEAEVVGGEAEEVEPVKEDVVESIHSDEMIGKAKALGLSDEDLADFGTEGSLRRYVESLEKIQGLSATKVDDDKPVEVVDEPVAEEKPADELIDIAAYEDDWDERSLAIPKALRREQELRIEAQKQLESIKGEVERLSSLETQRLHEASINKFHDAVDSIEDELFGSSRDERGRIAVLTPQQVENRTKLFQEVDTLAAAMDEKSKKSGEPMKLTWDEVIEKARVLAFGSPKAARKPDKSEALKAQSASRRPVGTSAGASRRVAVDSDSPEAIANSPEVVAMWDRFQRENGV